MSLRNGAIATNRFGLGARPAEIKEASSDPRGWLKAQIRADAALLIAPQLASARAVFAQRAEQAGGVRRGAAGDQSDRRPQENVLLERVQTEARNGLARDVQMRLQHGAQTRAPFAERWARFWSNHFTVSARTAPMIGLAGPFEREAIRPHVFGDFTTLLRQAVLHPAMLVYLDAHRSIGPSTAAARRRDGGLNENLAREVLELHTLGAGSGYTQTDIIEFAKALTGWGIPQLAAAGPLQAAVSETEAGSLFRAPLHEPGQRVILGKTYRASGPDQSIAVLRDLARHPSTARRVAYKLAQHFIADDPSEAAVAALEISFQKTGGDLAALAGALVDLDASWANPSPKFRTPDDLLTAVSRAAGWRAAYGRDPQAAYQSLGQQPFRAPSPAGWPDDTAAWSGADALTKRIEWANAAASRIAAELSPVDLLDISLGELASQRTREGVARAESREQGLVLAIMSPEFQRR